MSVERDRRTSVDPHVAERSRGPSTPSPDQRPPWSWLDRPVVDVDGRPIGVVVTVCADGDVGPAAWFGIDVGGLDELDIVIAPTASARLVDDAVMVVPGRDQATAPPGSAPARARRRTQRCPR